MKCIDFDKAFAAYTRAWFAAHAREYKNYDAMEEAMPAVYARFLDTAADFLAGAKPGEYFDAWDDAKLLVDWMEDYYKQNVPVPDMLLNRIAALGEGAQPRLMALLQKPRAPQAARMMAVSLLREMESVAPLALYIQWHKAKQTEDDLCDIAAESLLHMGEAAVPAMLEALDDCPDAGREALLGVLSHYPDENGLVLRHLLSLFEQPEAHIAILAGYLGRLGDERALEALIDRALGEDVEYLDYIELRAAIEQLGGDAPPRRFDQRDPAYEAMAYLQSRGRAHGTDDADDDTGDVTPVEDTLQ